MDVPIQPIFLLADSQLLFWHDGEELFLEQVRRLLETDNPKAAYVGASNGDAPEFYQLFEGAMEAAGVRDCHQIPSEPSAEDLEFFDSANLILLAGGDVERGWKTYQQNGLKQKLVERYYTGAMLFGVSAGAVQLGLYGWRQAQPGGDEGKIELFETFKLIPLVIDAHQEPDWRRLGRALPEAGAYVQGLGIPSGGGAIVYPDMTVEPVRRPLTELCVQDGEIRQSLVWPPRDERASDQDAGEKN